MPTIVCQSATFVKPLTTEGIRITRTGSGLSNWTVKHISKNCSRTKETVLLDFYASWCKPCDEQLLELHAAKFEDDVTIVTVDVDRFEALTERLLIENIPTLILYRGGMKKAQISGLCRKGEIEKLLD